MQWNFNDEKPCLLYKHLQTNNKGPVICSMRWFCFQACLYSMVECLLYWDLFFGRNVPQYREGALMLSIVLWYKSKKRESTSIAGQYNQPFGSTGLSLVQPCRNQSYQRPIHPVKVLHLMLVHALLYQVYIFSLNSTQASEPRCRVSQDLVS